MLRILTKRERIILYLTGGVFVFAVSFNFCIAPILNRNDILNKEISLGRAKLKKYLWLLSQKDYIQSKYSKFSSTLQVSGEQPDSLVSILAELESIAQKANIRIIDIRPQASRGSGLYQELIIDLRAEGAMEGYLSFIYNLENSLSLLRIKRFQLTVKPNAAVLEGSFSISRISPL